MASSATTLPRALHSITITKIRELQKQRNAFAVKKQKVLDKTKKSSDLRTRAAYLHRSLQKLDQWNDAEFCNLKRWIAQASYDPSIPDERVEEYQASLLNRLDIESRKLDLADLYSRLITEWIEQGQENDVDLDLAQHSTNDLGSYEMIQSAHKERLDQLRDKFAHVVFEPLHTDEVEIDHYLYGLFQGEAGAKALHSLRHQVYTVDSNLNLDTVDRENLVRTIKALQADNMLSDDKKATLDGFLLDAAVLDEIQDVLNMRLKDIDNWEWDLAGGGIPVVPVNGTWRIVMDEDVIQALLTHFIGTSWAVKIKRTFRDMISIKSIWKHADYESTEDQNLRKYYLNNPNGIGPELYRHETFRTDFFMAPLPSTRNEAIGVYDNDDDSSNERKSGREIKQQLLRTVATEVLLRKAFDDEFVVVQSDFQWFATGISLDTVFSTLRFIGFNEQSMRFIRKVLEPPLDTLDGSPVRIRKRGLPMSHIFEKLCGEIVLFFLDLAVNQDASQILYRFHDDLWVVGKPDRCAQAWTTIQEFTKVMGLELNKSKTGSVYWMGSIENKDPGIVKILPEGSVHMDFLTLNPTSGKWGIDQVHVQRHVEQLRRRLAETKSVLEWVKTWNSCIGRFFGYTFGEPAQCFGRPHLDAILQTHQHIQQFLFDGGEGTSDSVTAHLKQMISARFSVSPEGIPDAFIYMPCMLGGLGLVNPFISLLLAREDLLMSPEAKLEEYLEHERCSYEQARKAFEALSDRERRRRWVDVFGVDTSDNATISPPTLSWTEAQIFPSLEQFTHHRELRSTELARLYQTLGETPNRNDISQTQKMRNTLKAVRDQGVDSSSISDEMQYNMAHDKHLMWLLEYYHDDMMRDFGGLRCVQKDLLPFGVLGAMDKKQVTWHMVI